MPESYLIPTVADFADAHEEPHEEPLYRDLLTKLDTSDPENPKFPWTFEVVKGFFKQSEDSTDDLKFNYATEDMGIQKPWEQILEELHQLNLNAGENQNYKLLFLARHGQGYHNVVINKYSYEEWYKKWYKETHDGDMQFAPDPMLTDLGINQAKENHQLWKQQVAKGAPIPSKFFVSPLQRSSHTLVHTWTGIKPESSRPVVTEGIRETCGLNLCDKRSTKSVINQRFGDHGFTFEDGFTEEDQLFDHDNREPLHRHAIRTNQFLQRLFDSDFDKALNKVDRDLALKHQVISTTSHAGTIRTFIMVLGHRHFTISTGGMIPVVVKATRRILKR